MLKVFKKHPDAKLPIRSTDLSAGYDLFALSEGVIPARGHAKVPTGLTLVLPECEEKGMLWTIQICSRSGLSVKNSLEKGAGLIDADYRGETMVVLYNHSDVDYHYSTGAKIAQFIITKVATFEIEEVDSIDETTRGEGGFGSTGI